MKEVLRQLSLDLPSVEGESVFTFKLGDDFLTALEQELISTGNFDVELTLIKTTGMVKVVFDIRGTMGLLCDRSLRDFDYHIASKNVIFFKFSDRDEEVAEDIVLIKEDTLKIDFSIYVFEQIALSVPVKKIHPDLITKEDEESDENILVYSSVSDTKDLTDTDIDILDPRWEALKKLKDTL